VCVCVCVLVCVHACCYKLQHARMHTPRQALQQLICILLILRFLRMKLRLTELKFKVVYNSHKSVFLCRSQNQNFKIVHARCVQTEVNNLSSNNTNKGLSHRTEDVVCAYIS
jgi:hypothetical protein